jgi:hypothetical protein
MTEGLESIIVININWIRRVILNVCLGQTAAHNL